MSSRATARTAARPPSAPARAAGGAPRTTTGPTPRVSPRAGARPALRLVQGTTPARARRQVGRSLRNRRAPFVLLVVALLVGTTIGLLILNTAIAVDSLNATQLRAENAQRAQEVQRLEQQVVAASTPAEIARAAMASGLVPAGPAAYLVLGPDGTSVLRGIPEPAQGADDEATGDEGTDEAATDDEATDEAVTDDEAATDEVATDETATDDEAATDEPATDEAATDEAATDEAATEDEVTGDGDGG